MKLKTKTITIAVATLAAFSFALPLQVQAAKGDIGTDWAKYQGYSGRTQYGDKFAIAQIGGTYGGTLINQDTYVSQVNTARSNGLRVHTYIWYGVGSSLVNAKAGLDYYLPRVITPKGSIVALDYEDGASSDVEANTDAILYGMQRIAQAGYTPMYYSYKPYTLAHIDYKRILAAFPNSLWIAAYPDYQVRTVPDFNWFPSMDGVAIWQFTNTHAAGGLDGNVDLLGVTDNGYSKQPSVSSSQTVTVPSQNTQSSAASDADYAQSGIFRPSTRVNIRIGAGTGYAVIGSYAPGESVVYDHVYIRGNYVWARYLSYSGRYHYVALGVNGGESFGSRTSYSSSTANHTYYTIQSGDSFWSISQKFGVNMYTLATNNGKSINSMIHPGQQLLIR
ncbi:LysM peptidoglycan-binding domain-containing protein [Lactobacillus rhamnosus]|uniref:LysM peptidoglycan-binding domain-containing protein n=1 Tax=Lacticaseibacillus rhamnosus TaxID=47715 RepID=A0A7Y7UIZ2_LACRH|nr:GH25 family lysozyme [Lacticaseibacillus rhamnosus]NVO88962.1 LysM peptidoglycan-binding domain-containing protein [Lacticaseibacillus rhamnosus]